MVLAISKSYTQSEKSVSLQSQPGKQIPKGKTYALIFGISKYQNFRSLNYADRDAIAFHSYLSSKTGGSIDSADIFIRLNERAKAGDIWTGISWLEKRADTVGETAYIYFSGHGDAANAEEAYLLAHDAPNEGDPNLYNMGGTFQIYNLKVKIKKMVAKGVRVILITDACRTNELPGKENGNRWTFANITEQRSGEIQMASCASNEQSVEDAKWGNGRGLFSYYLINGLNGLADNDPEDGEVTLYELQKYVKDNVRKETKSITTGKAKQNPVFCCEEFNENTMAKVDASVKAKTLASINNNSQTTYATASRGNNDLFKDTTAQKLYKQFLKSIEERKLIEPEHNCAVNYLDKLLPLVNDELIKSDLKDLLVGELVNEAQQVINKYTKPVKDTSSYLTFSFFNRGAKHLYNAEKYFVFENDFFKDIKAKRLFLESKSMLNHSSSKKEIVNAIEKALESNAINPTNYSFQILGLGYGQLKKYDSALYYFHKATENATDWFLPYQGIKNTYFNKSYRDKKLRLQNLDSAFKYAKKIELLEPNQLTNVMDLATILNTPNNYNSAIYYYKKLIDTCNFPCYGFLVDIYKTYNNIDSIKNILKYLDSRVLKTDKHSTFMANMYLEIHDLYNAERWISKVKDFSEDGWFPPTISSRSDYIREAVYIDTIFKVNVEIQPTIYKYLNLTCWRSYFLKKWDKRCYAVVLVSD